MRDDARMANTEILIRVQARGGKFLGPDINFSYVRVLNAGGKVLAEGAAGSNPATDNSGNLTQTLSAGASTGVVLTYGTDAAKPPQVSYLTADPASDHPTPTNPTTAFFRARFDLAAPELLTIEALGRDPDGNPSGAAGRATTWVAPGNELAAEPGFIVEIAGLAVTIGAVKALATGFYVSAKVTMMCGCPIDDEKTAKNPQFIPWPSREFVVTAELWNGAAMVSSAPLSLHSTSNFGGAIACTGVAPGTTLELRVKALQASIANYGYASRALTI